MQIGRRFCCWTELDRPSLGLYAGFMQGKVRNGFLSLYPFVSVIQTMHLPSFLWLWRIAAWSMGWTVSLYLGLLVIGLLLRRQRLDRNGRPMRWLRRLHVAAGVAMVVLVLVLLTIGIVGTLGHFGSLGHSWHLPVGLTVVGLAIASALSGRRIHPKRPLSRPIHLGINSALAVALLLVVASGWSVVQKYLP